MSEPIVLRFTSNNHFHSIVLDKKCETCRGRRERCSGCEGHGLPHAHECEECDHLGFIPTEAGKAILELVRRHGGAM